MKYREMADGVQEGTTTPPLPSSSPGPGLDSMDMSPLPHKVPFSAMAEVQQIPSETPMPSSRLDLDSSPSSLPALPSEPAKPTVLHQ